MKINNKGYNGIRAGIWYTAGNILVKGIPFFSLPIFTRLLTTSDFGIYNTYLAYEGILSIILGMGLSGTVRTAKFEFENTFEKFISSIMGLILLNGFITLVIVNSFFRFLWIPKWMDRLMLSILIIQSVATAIYGIMGCKYVIKGQYIQNLLITFIMTSINIGASMLLCYVGLRNYRAWARIIGTALGAIVVALFIIINQQKAEKISFYTNANKYALKIGLPLIPHLLSATLLSQCDKIMIESIVGSAEAGIYSIAVNIISILAVFVTSIDNAWAPWYYTELSNRNFANIKEKNNCILVFFMYLTCGFLLVGPDVIRVMTEKAYWDSIYAFVPLSISIYLNFMYLFAVNLEYFKKKTWHISAATIICAIVNIILNYIFIMKAGYLAAAYATLISKILLFALHQYNSRRLEREKIVSYRYLLGTLCVVSLIGVLDIFWIYNYVIRYIVILLLSVLVGTYFYKKGYFDKYKKNITKL